MEKSQAKIIMAKNIFTSLIDVSKTYVNYYNLANSYSALNCNQQAISAYKEAVKLKANFAMAWKNLDSAYYYEGDLNQALSCYENSLKYEPSLPEVLFCKGSLLAKNGQYDEAPIFYDRTIENSEFVSLCPSIYYWKSYVMFEKTDFENALHIIDLYLMHKPADYYGMKLKARILAKLWRKTDDYIPASKHYFESILEIFNNADWILTDIYLLCLELNDVNTARYTFEQLLRNYDISIALSKETYKKVWRDNTLISLFHNIDFYLAFRKISSIDDFRFDILDVPIEPTRLFWLPYAMAFCKSMDFSVKMNECTAKTLANLFENIFIYVEESCLIVIHDLCYRYYLCNTTQYASIISACIAYLSDIWIMEATRIYSWICIRRGVSLDISNRALDITMESFDQSRCIEPYIVEFNKVWKIFKD